MKSQLNTLKDLAACIIEDARLQCDLSRVSVSRDTARLVRCAHARGLPFFTVDLPSLDQMLLQSLEEGHLVVSPGPLTRRRSKDDVRPRFLNELWNRVFDSNGRVVDDVCSTSILFLRQIFCLGKKLEVRYSRTTLSNVVKEYWKNEQTIKVASLRWGEDDPVSDHPIATFSEEEERSRRELGLLGADPSPAFCPLTEEDRRLLSNLDLVSGMISSTLGVFDLYSIETEDSSLLRHGPGAVSDGNKHTFKYVFPHWPRKLEKAFPYSWNGTHDLSVGEYSQNEPPSRLCAVPKTAKGPRLIASEPICHQWNQQLVARWIGKRISDTFIGSFVNFRRQDLSGKLVLRASRTKELATIDLKSASDLLSCSVVERFFRRNTTLLEAFHSVRTRTVYDGLVTGQRAFIKKFAAQGSALTFPVQTLVFLGIALASCHCTTLEDIKCLKGKVRVFGDDIIVPSDSYDRAVRLLSLLGLRVNLDKSFVKGYFRESCGTDAYGGYDVTPVKPKVLSRSSPSGYQAWIDTSNNFHKRGFWKTAQYMSRRLDRNKVPVVDIHLGAFGLSSFTGSDTSRCKPVWNRNLQRDEILVRSVRTRSKKVKVHNAGALLQYFVEDPSQEISWSSGVQHGSRNYFATTRVPLRDYHAVLHA